MQLTGYTVNRPPTDSVDGLTGALLFSADAFAQVLEGPESVVWETYHRIEADPRHQPAPEPQFGPVEDRDHAQQLGRREHAVEDHAQQSVG